MNRAYGSRMWKCPMSTFEYFEQRVRLLGILDTKLAQAASFFSALVIVQLFPEIMSVSIWWFVLAVAICAIGPVITFYSSPEPSDL